MGAGWERNTVDDLAAFAHSRNAVGTVMGAKSGSEDSVGAFKRMQRAGSERRKERNARRLDEAAPVYERRLFA
ncbi:hypothetical protein D3C71_2085740 [compost metagenome]